jgi:hypothetical protein
MLKNTAQLLETEITIVKFTMNQLRRLSRLILFAAFAIALLVLGTHTIEDSPDSYLQTQIIDFEMQPRARLFVGVL